MEKLTVRDIAVSGKRVLVRVDFNVPMDEKAGTISDDSRIRESLPTIKYLIDQGTRIVLCSHLGRPDGKVVEKLRLAPVGRRLSQLLGKQVATTGDCVGPDVEKAVQNMKAGDVMLLENLRFHAEEEKNDPAFAQALARLADIYVNDAFGTAHRAHASTAGITKYLPAVAGFLMEKEINNLDNLLEKPARPFGGLFGGAKISDKVSVLENIMSKVDSLMIGGGMVATFLKAKGYEIGQSLLEADKVSTAANLMEKANKAGVRLLLPADVLVADKVSADAKTQVVAIDKVLPQQRIVDIGPKAIRDFSDELRKCKTVFWNGPMGIFEIPLFAEGTKALASLLAGLKATTVIGGGSTAEAVASLGLVGKMTFVSTGGGAALEFLGGTKLPGVEALIDKNSPAAAKLKKG